MYKKIILSLMSGITSLCFFMCTNVEAANPVGSVQVAISEATQQLHVRGIAYDPDDMSRPVRLHVYVGGTPGQNVPQYEIRTNPHTRVFDDVRNIGGSKTGYQLVHVYALNDVGSEENVEIWNGTVYIKSVNHNPRIGGIQIDSPEPGKLHVKCTGVIDDDDVNGDVRLHVYVGGEPGSSPSVVPQYQIVASGRTHVIEDTRFIEKTGNQVVNIYALNDYGPGSNVKVYSNTVYIKPKTTSVLTRNSGSGTKVTNALNWMDRNQKVRVGTGQCVALIKKYAELLGLNNPVAYGNACDYATNPLQYGWIRVEGGVPQPGDILVYKGAKYGHVAIYAGGNVSYHQNMAGKWIEKKTNWPYDKRWYSTAEGGQKYYWGYIRPNI